MIVRLLERADTHPQTELPAVVLASAFARSSVG